MPSIPCRYVKYSFCALLRICCGGGGLFLSCHVSMMPSHLDELGWIGRNVGSLERPRADHRQLERARPRGLTPVLALLVEYPASQRHHVPSAKPGCHPHPRGRSAVACVFASSYSAEAWIATPRQRVRLRPTVRALVDGVLAAKAEPSPVCSR